MEGKTLPHELKTISLSLNEDMVGAIIYILSWLKNIVVFFACLDKEFFPSQKFFDEWVANVWGKKLGIHVTFCRMVHKGLFVVFVKSHNMQERILNKEF